MQLKNIMPYNGTDGFEIDSLQKNKSLVGNNEYSSFLIDYHLEVRIWSNGRDPTFPRGHKLRILISQFTDNCNIGLRSQDPEAIIVVLSVDQTLTEMRLVEAGIGEHSNYLPYLMLSVQDVKTKNTRTSVWDILKMELVTSI